MNYFMRAEFKKDGLYLKEDFQMTGENLEQAKMKSEGYICQRWNLPMGSTVFDWRGQVVFVNQGMGIRV